MYIIPASVIYRVFEFEYQLRILDDPMTSKIRSYETGMKEFYFFPLSDGVACAFTKAYMKKDAKTIGRRFTAEGGSPWSDNLRLEPGKVESRGTDT